MDDLDKQLLNILQKDFPIASRPYQVLARRLGLGEQQVLERIAGLTESGVIRRIGPVFDTRKLGHVSTLAAMRIPPERLQEVADLVSAYPQVTHNYSREHEYNLWFTLICRDSGEIDRILADIRERTGIDDIVQLPAERLFKINVSFEL